MNEPSCGWMGKRLRSGRGGEIRDPRRGTFPRVERPAFIRNEYWRRPPAGGHLRREEVPA
jgi:hypothetical protein